MSNFYGGGISALNLRHGSSVPASESPARQDAVPAEVREGARGKTSGSVFWRRKRANVRKEIAFEMAFSGHLPG
jgi:hypothetical protein